MTNESVQFLKTVGLLFNFLVAFEANQKVTLSFPLLSTVDLSGTSVHTVQGIGIVAKFRELVNLILRQCKDVNDHVFKRFVFMPILKEELPSSLKTLKYVDIAGIRLLCSYRFNHSYARMVVP